MIAEKEAAVPGRAAAPVSLPAIAYYIPLPCAEELQNYKIGVNKIMNEIKVAENKTLKLTNVLSRRVQPEEVGNMMLVLTQMHNFIKSHNAMPVGPLVQAIKVGTGPDHAPELYMLQQATQLIPQMEPGYTMDAVLRVKGCLYAHYTGPLSHSQLASAKLQILAFENDLKLSGNTYTIYVNQDDDDAVVDVFMETK